VRLVLFEQSSRPALHGQGTIDFARMFTRLEGGGYRGHYMMAFGSLDDMLARPANTW